MKGKRKVPRRVKRFFGFKGGLVGRRSKSDVGLHISSVNVDSPPLVHQTSRSRTSLNSTDDEEIKQMRQAPAIFVSAVGDRLNTLAHPLAIYGETNVQSSASPGSVKGAESPMRSDSPIPQLNLSSVSPGSRKSSKGNDFQLSPRTPNKQIVPKMNKSRNDKFHKLFKSIPENEMCLKGYSCAYMGDILLQGYLYISPNWFCFHCKILGIEKQIKIQVQNVLNITREKTAIFIPNAVGVVTSEDKYVFGSLMSRDNTYRIMYTVWKSLVEPGTAPEKVQDVLQIPDDVDGTDCGNPNPDGTSIDDSESDVSICMHCGRALHEHANETLCEGNSASESMNNINAEESINPQSSQTSPARPVSTSSTITNSPSTECKSSTTSPSQGPGSQSLSQLKVHRNFRQDYSYRIIRPHISASKSRSGTIFRNKRVNGSGPGHQKASVISATFQNARRIPKTNLMLLVCMVMVMFLSISAVIMLHKILVLQAVLNSTPGHSANDISSEEGVYSSMYYMNHEYHVSSIKRFHSILEANINVLDQIHSSLNNLRVSISQHKTNSCESEERSESINKKDTNTS